MSKPHVHADLMMEYAILAQVTDRPWEHFEHSFDWGVDVYIGSLVKRKYYLIKIYYID